MIEAGELRRLCVRLARLTGWGMDDICQLTVPSLLSWLEAAAEEVSAEAAARSGT
jgi:hypothetical protein